MSRSKQTLLHRFGGLYLPAVVALIGMVRVWSFTIDDAYISYRYAHNLARGWGLVYNYGERIEGYTNFLWTLILAGLDVVGVDLDLGAKVLGASSALMSLWLLYRLAERVRRFTLLPCLATWVLASSMTFSGYAVFGLETPFFVMLVLAGAVAFLGEEDGERAAEGWSAVPWSGVLFGLAGLTRPEAPLFIGLFMLMLPGPRLFAGSERALDGLDRRFFLVVGLVAAAWLYIAYLHLDEPTMGARIGVALIAVGLAGVTVAQLPRAMFARQNLVRGGIFTAMVGAHLFWRRSYYGRWVPNTLTAKTGDLAEQLERGLSYVTEYGRHEGLILVVALFGIAAALLWRHLALWVAAALVPLVGAYVVMVGGDWMPVFRFFAPALPFSALLIGVGARAVFERRDRLVSIGLGLLVALIVVERWYQVQLDIAEIHDKHQDFWRRTATPTVAFFEERSKRYGDAARGFIALGDIGEIGYGTDYPVFDLLGLVDPMIAAEPGGYGHKTGQGFRDRFFDLRPRYVVIISQTDDCQRPFHDSFKALYYDPRFRSRYVLVHAIPIDGWGWCIFEHAALVPSDVTPLGSKPR